VIINGFYKFFKAFIVKSLSKSWIALKRQVSQQSLLWNSPLKYKSGSDTFTLFLHLYSPFLNVLRLNLVNSFHEIFDNFSMMAFWFILKINLPTIVFIAKHDNFVFYAKLKKQRLYFYWLLSKYLFKIRQGYMIKNVKKQGLRWRKLQFFVHCHQKVVFGLKPKVLIALFGMDIKVLQILACS